MRFTFCHETAGTRSGDVGGSVGSGYASLPYHPPHACLSARGLVGSIAAAGAPL